VPVLLAALLAVMAVAHVAWKGLLGIVHLPATWSHSRRRLRQQKGYRALTDGLAAVAGGDAKTAGKLAGRAEKLLGDPALTRLLAAQSATLAGDAATARDHYNALLERPETEASGLRGLLDQALAAGDDGQAIDLATQARKLLPADPGLVDILETLYLRAGRLDETETLLDDALRRKALGRAEVDRRRARLLDSRAADAERKGDREGALAVARRAVKADPALAMATLRLSRLLMAQGKKRDAAAALEKAWQASPDPAVAEAYAALAPVGDALARVRHLEKLAQQRPDDVLSHRLVGEACLAAKLWGKARSHLLAAAEARPEAATYRLLADLEMGEYNNATAAQAWLDKAAAT